MIHAETFILLALQELRVDPILIMKGSKEACEEREDAIIGHRRITDTRIREVEERLAFKTASEVGITTAIEYSEYRRLLIHQREKEINAILKLPEAEWYDYTFIIL